MDAIMNYVWLGLEIGLPLIGLLSSVFFVQEKTFVILQRLGKFHRIAGPGIGFRIPFIDLITTRVNMKVQQMDVTVETKTADNVFVKMEVSVQYQVRKEKVYEAFYSLEDPMAQINSYVYDVVRASVPKMKLDDVFQKKDDIAKDIKESLDETMDKFGFDIIQALVTDIDPDEGVKTAMNRINAAEREKAAAEAEGESNKIKVVKQAEADAESKKLQGLGIANQRRAIVDGLKESVKDMAEATGVKPDEVMSLVLLTQYFDTLKEVGATSKSNVLFIPHSPGGLTDMRQQIMEAFAAAKE